MKEAKIIQTIQRVLYALVAGTPLFYLSQTVYPTIVSKTVFFQIGVEILFGLWLVLAFTHLEFRPRLKSPLVVSLLIFLSLFTLTAFLGVDAWRSFWSTEDRMLGVFFWWHIGALIVVLTSLFQKIDWTKLWLVSLATACVSVVISTLQLLIPGLILGEMVTRRPGGTFGNPTFLAGYLLLHIFIILYLFLEKRGVSRGERGYDARWLLGALLVCAFGLLQTETRGDILAGFLGLVVFALLFFVFLGGAWSRYQRYIALGVLLLCSLGGIFFGLTRTATFWNNVPVVNRFLDISLDSQELRPRVIAWRAGWQGFLERPIAGWGWDNFNVVFNKYYDPRALESGYQETRFDKPHNVLLEYLVSGGVILFLAYLGFFIALWYASYRVSPLLSVVSSVIIFVYFVRNLVVFETLGPVLVLALWSGFVYGKYEERVRAGDPKKNSRLSGQYPHGLVVAIFVGISILALFNVKTVQATYHQFWGFRGYTANRPTEAIAHFRRAIRIWTPYRAEIKRDYAAATADAYFYNTEQIPREAVLESVWMMEGVAKDHPLDSYNHSILVDIYNQTADVNPEYLTRAEEAGRRALALSPNRQQVLFSLAKTKSLQNDYPGALALAKQGLDLSPNVPDGHFFYGLLAYASDDSATGYIELQEAIRLGKKWKSYQEPLVVGNLFADSGHLEDAIELYEVAQKMEPENPEVKMKLGVAYFIAGRRDEAYREISEVMRTTDLRNSPGYESVRPIIRQLGLE